MAPSPTLRRLLREAQELSPASPHPNAAFHAAPVSDSDLHEWHFTLLGPPSPSPYAGGLYHGRISLPPQYPLKPPNFRFLTPSGRFEVNREICLSISGFHEETWMPAWGVRTALTALRGFMGEEGTAGQVGGLEAPKHIRRQLAKESRHWRCHECNTGTAIGAKGRGRTNEEIMQEWWGICRSKGVQVDEEGMVLEALPDGMKVEGFDRSRNPNPEQGEKESTAATAPEALSPSPASSQTVLQSKQPTSITAPQDGTRDSPIPSSSAASPPTSQSSQPSQHLTTPLSSSLQPDTISTSTPATATEHTNTQNSPTISLDRAITAVFLALVLMILKKIFLPSLRDPDQWDDYVGLSREY